MIFLGSIYQKIEESTILKFSKVGLSNADNTLQYNIIEGIEENLKQPISIINVPNIGSYPKAYGKLILKSMHWKHRDSNKNNFQVGTFNIPIIKHIIIGMKLKKIINSEFKNVSVDKNIIIYSTYLPFLKSIYKLNDDYKITLIVTDLPELYNGSKINSIKNIFQKLNIKLVYKYMERIDSFVLLTDQMKYPLKVGSRPYVVVEGMINYKDNKKNESSKNNKKIILYTGSLHSIYGIKELLDSFKFIKDRNYELWICGFGDAESEVIKSCENDERIKFYGYVSKKEVEKLQNDATIMINPRTNNGEYNKYSFPSKTMEYMLTGKPIIMYKLDGIPDEYDDFIYYIDGNRAEDIANKILEVCDGNEENIKHIGEKAKQFVLEKKNNIKQTEKILSVVKGEI